MSNNTILKLKDIKTLEIWHSLFEVLEHLALLTIYWYILDDEEGLKKLKFLSIKKMRILFD
jgi:hypothetical protein